MGRPPFVIDFATSGAEIARYRDPISGKEREVFFIISTHPGITTTEVAERAKVATEVGSRAIKKLIALGWVTERKDRQDRRINRLGMTNAGFDALLDHYAKLTGKKPGTFTITGVHVWNPDE